MKASIITVGTEILIGSILNTNSKYISSKLTDAGVDVIRQSSVDDNMDDIVREIETSVEKSDLIILTGGLGPTDDDITREAVAKYLNREIYLDENEKRKMEERFLKLKRTFTKNNLKQIMLIEGSEKINNNWGVALGEVVSFDNKKILLLPGPPSEMEPMFDSYLTENINSDEFIIIKSIDVIGIGESAIEDKIRKMKFDKSLSINTFAMSTHTEVKIIGKSSDKESLEISIKDAMDKLYEEFRNHIFSESNEDVAEKIVEILKNNNLKVSFAESITGGMLASAITNISGASNVLETSIVTYSNDSKHINLNVSEETLKSYGAISEETVLEMARGLKEKTNCDIAISTSGEAGPNPSETEVGTVYTCIYFSDEDNDINHYFLSGNRNKIRKQTVYRVLSQLLYILRRKF